MTTLKIALNAAKALVPPKTHKTPVFEHMLLQVGLDETKISVNSKYWAATLTIDKTIPVPMGEYFMHKKALLMILTYVNNDEPIRAMPASSPIPNEWYLNLGSIKREPFESIRLSPQSLNMLGKVSKELDVPMQFHGVNQHLSLATAAVDDLKVSILLGTIVSFSEDDFMVE